MTVRVHIERLVVEGGLSRAEVPLFRAALARELAEPGAHPPHGPAGKLAREAAAAIRQRAGRP